ncbi:MAG: formate dehydrogenase accessory protein FdhE [Deltaproteobacteria bacterium]|nr:formate dehydrogenase accessory protein FdhE [Deltaproteobacteria bacterium]
MKTLADYRAELPHYGDCIALLNSVRELRKRYRENPLGDVFALLPSAAASRLESGRPLTDLGREKHDLQKPRAYFLELLGIAAFFDAEASSRLRLELNRDAELYGEMVRRLFNPEVREAGSQKTEANPAEEEAQLDLTTWLLNESLKPFFIACREKHDSRLRGLSWAQSRCPVCSRPASLGLIRNEDGARSLFCLQCDWEWSFPRLQCPFCGGREPKDLAYFTVEGDEKRRVDICRHCRRYLKTFDARKLGAELSPELENLVSLHLDLRAAVEGYS